MTANVASLQDWSATRSPVLHAPTRRCPECLRDTPKGNVLFCSPEHRVAWHNRQTVRGRVLTSLVMAARQTRDGTRGKKGAGKQASAEANALMMRWTDEDKRAGRMSAIDYAELRFRFERTDSFTRVRCEHDKAKAA